MQQSGQDGGEVGPARAPLSRTSLPEARPASGHRPAPSLTSHRPSLPFFLQNEVLPCFTAGKQLQERKLGTQDVSSSKRPNEPPQDEQSRRRLWSLTLQQIQMPVELGSPCSTQGQLQMGEGAMVGAPALGQGLSGDPNRPGLLPPPSTNSPIQRFPPTSSDSPGKHLMPFLLLAPANSSLNYCIDQKFPPVSP